MTMQTLGIEATAEAVAEAAAEPAVDAPEAGVIRDARRHRRRERIAVSLLCLAVIGALLFLVERGGAKASLARASRPTWLAGAPLQKPTHLRLLVSENGGPASIVNVDERRVQAVAGLGLPHAHRLWGPMMWPLTKLRHGALGVVHRQPCKRCTATETHFLIGADGSVRRISAFTLAPDQRSTTPVLGSASAIWVLTRRRGEPCELRVEPGSRPAVTAPCGTLQSDNAAGVIIATGNRMVLVDPRTGAVRARSPLNGQLDAISRSLALTGGQTGIEEQGQGAALTLLDLRTGARTRLRWPSILTFGYEVYPEPHSPLVAVEFADPAYAGVQAGDVWLLNTRTRAFTHVPGFPILEYLKFSGIAWTGDRRLVIVAQGGGRTAIGIWRPGSRRLQVGTLPGLSGYSAFVPFVR